MIRSLNQYIKLPLLLFLVDIEASELEKSRKEKLQLRNEIVRTVSVSSPPNSHKPLTLPSLLEGVDKNELTPEGKKKKAIDKLVYHLELCTMCNLCVEACPSDAIKMAQTFEHSVFDRSKLTKVLNHPGSKIMEGVE